MKNVYWLTRYNTLKLKSKIEKKNLLKEIDSMIQELAEARADIEYCKVKEKLARKQLKQLREKIKEEKHENSSKGSR